MISYGCIAVRELDRRRLGEGPGVREGSLAAVCGVACAARGVLGAGSPLSSSSADPKSCKFDNGSLPKSRNWFIPLAIPFAVRLRDCVGLSTWELTDSAARDEGSIGGGDTEIDGVLKALSS